jgi:adenylate cyclase
VESIIAGAQLTRPDVMKGLETLLVIVGGLFGLSAASRLAPLSGAVVTGLLVAAFTGISLLAFTSMQQLFDPLWPSAATLGSFGVAGVSVLRQTERERRQVREAFAHYLSPAVVESLARDPSRLVLGGETRVLTVMFSDIRGFTSRSETLSAEDVVGFLNSIHTPLTQHVLDTAGTLDKFMGDGMMAFWNAPVEVPDHVRAALRCALLMQRTIQDIDARLRAEAEAQGKAATPVSIGIGIHTGPACVGNIGSQQRFDYSAIGDTVNVASRVEHATRTLGDRVLLTEATRCLLTRDDVPLEPRGSVPLKGKSEPVPIWAPHLDAVGDDHLADALPAGAARDGAGDGEPLPHAAPDHDRLPAA